MYLTRLSVIVVWDKATHCCAFNVMSSSVTILICHNACIVLYLCFVLFCTEVWCACFREAHWQHELLGTEHSDAPNCLQQENAWLWFLNHYAMEDHYASICQDYVYPEVDALQCLLCDNYLNTHSTSGSLPHKIIKTRGEGNLLLFVKIESCFLLLALLLLPTLCCSICLPTPLTSHMIKRSIIL